MKIEWEDRDDGLVDIESLEGGDVFVYNDEDPVILEQAIRFIGESESVSYPKYAVSPQNGSRVTIETNIRVQKLNAKMVIGPDNDS